MINTPSTVNVTLAVTGIIVNYMVAIMIVEEAMSIVAIPSLTTTITTTIAVIIVTTRVYL